jgi:hypothetical protein
MESTAMKINFERTGGFAAAMHQAKTIDTANLPPDDDRTVRALIDKSDFFDQPSNTAAPKSSADMFQYKLTVEDGDRSHTVALSQTAVPEAMQPLLNWVTQKARQA